MAEHSDAQLFILSSKIFSILKKIIDETDEEDEFYAEVLRLLERFGGADKQTWFVVFFQCFATLCFFVDLFWFMFLFVLSRF
jgi:hypothetical protein